MVIARTPLILSALALSAFALSAFPAELSFKYTLPTTRIDGSKLAAAQIKTCTLYRGNVAAGDMGKSGAYTFNETSTQTITYSATCTDTNGVESAKSTTITISLSPPMAPVLEIVP